MKILVLAPHPFYQDKSNAITLKLLAEGLTKSGHHLTVMTYGEGEDITIPGCRFIRLRKSLFSARAPKGFSKRRLVNWLKMYRLASRFLKTEKVDLIHAREEAVFIARRLGSQHGIPFVYEMNSQLPTELCSSGRLLPKLLPTLQKMEKSAVEESIGVLAGCGYLENRVFGISEDIPVQRLDSCPLLGIIGDDAKRKSTALSKKKDFITFLYAGNLESYQDIDLLLESFSLACLENEKIQLVLIGGSSADIRKYKKQAAKLGIKGKRISFAGPKPVNDLAYYFQQADALISPRNKGETVPWKIYSYLDSGKPVLATNTLPHTQILDDSVALLVQANGTDMAAGIIKLANDSKLREELGTKGRELVTRRYTRYAFEQKLISFYRQIRQERVQKDNTTDQFTSQPTT
ncbi:glycosyltransferase [Desulfopila sp. IMCC35008]|uniref:glycosyltransferase n=1 Tax=Desulfopila sp. IMCC35008 TaxID=2653858 RepID=UPI0013D507EC|nr:glycosyltransferase [Desulfopila sp. IMCC35008]